MPWFSGTAYQPDSIRRKRCHGPAHPIFNQHRLLPGGLPQHHHAAGRVAFSLPGHCQGIRTPAALADRLRRAGGQHSVFQRLRPRNLRTQQRAALPVLRRDHRCLSLDRVSGAGGHDRLFLSAGDAPLDAPGGRSPNGNLLHAAQRSGPWFSAQRGRFDRHHRRGRRSHLHLSDRQTGTRT